MPVDWEAVVLEMKRHILSKRGHGQDELLAELAASEVRCQVPEGQEGFSDLPARHARPHVHEDEHELTQDPHPLPAAAGRG